MNIVDVFKVAWEDYAKRDMSMLLSRISILQRNRIYWEIMDIFAKATLLFEIGK